MSEPFFEPDGDGAYVAGEQTRGPWDPGAQHAGPPAALIARELERLTDGRIGGPDGPPAQVGRITLEILGSVPIGPVRVEAQVVRPGRRVEMVEASLSDGGGKVLVRARGWRLRVGEVAFTLPPGAPAGLPGPDGATTAPFFDTSQERGYHTAMDVRFLSGGFVEPGPARAWLRMRVPLVAGEEPTPLQRVMVVADVGNGVSAPLDWRRYLFINVDLSVHLHRLPVGEWIGIDAVTVPEPSGLGVSDSALYDQDGRIGRAAQTLLVDER